MGQDRPVRLPTFSSVGSYVSPDGRTEVDALAVGDENWIAEVRWQVGAATEEDVRRFLGKETGMPIHRRWFISRGGFRPRAVTLTAANGVYITDGPSYHRLRVQAREK